MASSSDFESKAKDAMIEDLFDLAVDLYSKAIGICPNNAHLYADRAQAYIKLNSFKDALADANKAIELDSKMAKAYLRKGTACIKLEEYQTAKAALEIGASLVPENSRYANLFKECERKIAEQAGNVSQNIPEAARILEHVPFIETVTKNSFVVASAEAVTAAAKPKYRHEYYQKPEEVVVTIFAKRVPPSCIKVDFGEQILGVQINIPNEEPYHFQSRLFAKIVPAKCKYEVLSTKVEIRLTKAIQIQWTSLEYVKETTTPHKINGPAAAGEVQRPSYPSSKTKRVDWDKLEAQVKKEEKEETLDGDAGANKLFREIFEGADEDTRRAMQKSFVESNGTVLSTNWKEVGEKRVEGSAPEGMELKKWEY